MPASEEGKPCDIHIMQRQCNFFGDCSGKVQVTHAAEVGERSWLITNTRLSASITTQHRNRRRQQCIQFLFDFANEEIQFGETELDL
jgi:hypothetical protein